MIETISTISPGIVARPQSRLPVSRRAWRAQGLKTLGGQITKLIEREIGLAITPHQFRHAAAALILRTDPGNYELVRRVLGHKSLATTTSFYIGLEFRSRRQSASARSSPRCCRLKMPHNARGWGNDLPISSTAGRTASVHSRTQCRQGNGDSFSASSAHRPACDRQTL